MVQKNLRVYGLVIGVMLVAVAVSYFYVSVSLLPKQFFTVLCPVLVGAFIITWHKQKHFAWEKPLIIGGALSLFFILIALMKVVPSEKAWPLWDAELVSKQQAALVLIVSTRLLLTISIVYWILWVIINFFYGFKKRGGTKGNGSQLE